MLTFREGSFELWCITRIITACKIFSRVIQILEHCFGHRFLSKATVLMWFRQCRSGMRALEDDDFVYKGNDCYPREHLCGKVPEKHDPQKTTSAKIQYIMKITLGSLSCIHDDCLGGKKHCACWIPHNLRSEQKRDGVDWCTNRLRKFDGESSHVWNTETGDKTWVYQYNPRRSNSRWCGSFQMRTHL